MCEITNNWTNDLSEQMYTRIFNQVDNHNWKYYTALILLYQFLNEAIFLSFLSSVILILVLRRNLVVSGVKSSK